MTYAGPKMATELRPKPASATNQSLPILNMTSDTGRCAMRGSCREKSVFEKSLPCPYDGLPQEPNDSKTQRLLAEVCGPSFVQGPVCCTSEQLEELRDNFNQVEGLISSCPACRNNFRSFFCTFTCSPNQGTFLNVTSTQQTQSNRTAVKSVDFHVTNHYGEGFFNSCKNVQVGATNSYAMDFIGGGAKDYHSFLAYMGEEKPIGSPFQINFPLTAPAPVRPLNDTPRTCSDNNLGSRCTCIDCPAICPTLPDVLPPGAEDICKVGPISCLTFFLLLAYLVATLAFLTGYSIRGLLKKRQDKTYDRVALSVDTASPRSHSRGLVGAGSLARYVEEDSIGALSESHRLGRETSLLDPVETVQPRHYPLNSFLRRAFYRIGFFAATSPWLTFTIALMTLGSLNFGWKFFDVETDPVQLWVAPDSESKLQKEFFDENFGPFYRTEQMFVTAASPQYNSSIEDNSLAANPVLSWERLKYWSNVESDIRSLRSPSGYTLSDICLKPAGTGPCVVQSIMGWFGNDLDNYSYDTWATRVKGCASRPAECLPDYQQPLTPQFLLGGVPLREDGSKDYINAEAFVVTYVVSNTLDPEVQARAMEWERALREYLLNLKAISFSEAGLEIAFSTGVSLEEEINKSTNTDVRTVVLSYLAMFLYVSFALGQSSGSRQDDGVVLSLLQWARGSPLILWSRHNPSADSRLHPLFPRLPRSMFIESRVMLSLFGICLVILSISSTVGLFSFIGVKVTLIIAEVIPFLVLAVGVDNVFILVHELDRQSAMHGPNATAGTTQEEHHATPLSPARSTVDSLRDGLSTSPMSLYVSAEERVARTLANMGPSILLSGVTETVAFALGALVPMPAVRNFALYAAGSVLLNAILQVTVFVSTLSLDLRRSEARRLDCFPCIKLPQRIELVDATPSPGIGKLAMFMRRYYAPFLLQPLVKMLVLLIFAGLAVLSVISMQHIQLGLDQRLALPSDSYLVDYFDDLDAFFDVGPPLYFVARDINVARRPGQQALCGRFTTCSEFSLANLLELERNRPESSFISEPGASWIDDFLGWLDPAKDKCCRVRQADPTTFCRGREPDRLCQPCYDNKVPAWNITMDGLPEDDEFMRYLKQWIISPTTEDCPLAGKASFANALSFSEDGDNVFTSNFRSFHSPLKSQADFINAYKAAHRIAREMSQHSGADIFPYSLFYVFFEQYAYIIGITQEVLGLGLAAVLATTALFLGSWRAGMIVTTVVALIVINVMGIMAVWGIDLNAISLVNLVISLGIAVEFCAHIARAFMNAGSGLPLDHPAAQKERDERVWASLVEIGPSVLSGITFTKLIGISVLALTRSRLLEIYYFRMWLTLILSGALHGLVLLPVILSIAGGRGTPQQEADEEWMSNAIRNGYEYPPFLADDDTNSSDT